MFNNINNLQIEINLLIKLIKFMFKKPNLTPSKHNNMIIYRLNRQNRLNKLDKVDKNLKKISLIKHLKVLL